MKRQVPVQIRWKPALKSAVPVYRQIVQYVCDKVSTGEWPIARGFPRSGTLRQCSA